MTKPVITYPYTPVLLRDWLRTRLSELGESGVTVSTKPLPGADEDRPLPYVRVSSDGGIRGANLHVEDGIRVNVWHPDEGEAYRIASVVEGVLLAAPWPDGIRAVTPSSRPGTPIPDPDTGEPFVTFRVIAAPAPQ